MYGKSTFFNYLVGTRISIVQDTPGVTRDRIYAETNWRGRNFTLVDTGGIEPESQDIILSQMREQANLAIEMADVIIFLTDIIITLYTKKSNPILENLHNIFQNQGYFLVTLHSLLNM